jgi:hypothetical protein
MNAIEHLGLTTRELPNELEFRFTSMNNRALQIVLLAFVFLCAVIAFVPFLNDHVPFFAFISAIFLAATAWMGIDTRRTWNKVYTTTLSATAQRLEATGDKLKPDWMGHYTRPGTIVLPLSEVKMLSYSPGDGQYCPSGLCVNSRVVMGAIKLQGRCLLPGLNREQATAIAVAITKRFPEIGAKMKQTP